jgi:phosphate uptake regulator
MSIPPARGPRAKAPLAPLVVDLAAARDARKLRDFQARTRAVDDVNRKALGRLFQTGLIYTRQGARLGRDLLLAHQHLLRVGDLLARIADLPDVSHAGDASALYDEAQGLLARTTELTARCGLVLARGR